MNGPICLIHENENSDEEKTLKNNVSELKNQKTLL